jgi:hypothetical protein
VTRPKLYFGWLLALGMVAGHGCGSQDSSMPATDEKFKQVMILYSTLFNSTGPPTSEAEFKEKINGRLKTYSERLGVTDVEALFVGRDGKPIVILYGKRNLHPRDDVVAYEQEGVAGKRMVGFPAGGTEEVDEQRFRELVPAPATAGN